ncbi:MAG: signal peptidase I [Lachnospiraceae bacterium]|nr:signal peptidase I [Lachnospiraceae bacterium]
MEKQQEAFCTLVEELLPLYQEHSIEESTEKVIREHLENCPLCQNKNKEIATVYKQSKIGRGNYDVLLSGQEQEERGKFRVLSRRLKKRKVRNACIGIVVAVCLFIVYQISFQTSFMAGDHMSPVVNSGDNCLISKVSYLIRSPQREDIVMLRIKEFRSYDLYRIVGIPGDEIVIAGGHLSVNGKINQRYEGIGAVGTYQQNPEEYRITVPEGQYFCLGDQYEFSYDSRFEDFGCVDRKDIIGKFLTSKLPHLGYESSMSIETGKASD